MGDLGEAIRILSQFIGLAILWVGIGFCILGILGLFRLPDVYCRLHASGKISTVGLGGLLLGTALIMPSTAHKAIALAIFLILTSPVSTHVIALSAYRLGVPMANPQRDDLGNGHEAAVPFAPTEPNAMRDL
jgi:multicomponent Na+:H+ antiporter subunit G